MGNSEGTVLEENLTFSMVDFFKEYEYLIKIGLARSFQDVDTVNFYRIKAKDRSVIKPKNSLRLRNARVICDGKIHGLGCDGLVKAIHPLQPSPDGHLLLKMGGPLDALSKCPVTCTCGTAFMMYADAAAGERDECYLTIATTQQPEEVKLGIRPFFETDGVDILSA